MKVLVVSPFPDDKSTYPQVSHFAKWLRRRATVRWLTISERGFRLDRLIEQTVFAADAGKTWRATYRLWKDWRAARRLARDSDLVVAIDYMALFLSVTAESPAVFWSLDFISADETRHVRKINRLWTSAVRRALARNRHLIVQDEERKRALERSIGVGIDEADSFYLPVCLPPVPVSAPECPSKPVVMQIGGLNAWRSRTDFLIEQYRAGHQSFDLFLHGEVGSDVAALLASLPVRPAISDKMVASEDIPAVVRECSIGFVAYAPTDEQFRHIKHASGQLVEFLRCGKPVISMGNKGLAELLEMEEAGIGVRSAEEFFDALRRIHSNYTRFSENALSLFKRRFNFETYQDSLFGFLQRAAADRSRGAIESSA